MNNFILFSMLCSHLLVDFIFQNGKTVAQKLEKGIKSWQLLWHATLAGVLAYGLSFSFDKWMIFFVVAITHYLIDLWKISVLKKGKDTLPLFLTDQALHILVIIALWFYYFSNGWLLLDIGQLLSTTKFWTVAFLILFLTTPSSILVMKIIQSVTDKGDSGENENRKTAIAEQIANQERSMPNAGKVIGIIERLMVFYLLTIGEYGAIGLLISAKTIVRIKEADRYSAEYVLIGSLSSYGLAMLAALIYMWGQK